MPRGLAKLTPPRLGRVVPRARLYRLLDVALESSAIWVGAPAGSGKTTAIVDYLAVRKTPLVWFRVDAGDLDPAAFFFSLAQSLPSTKRRDSLPVFGPEYTKQPIPFARRFFRAYFARLPAEAILVFDDLHVAAVTLVPDIVAVAIEELPPDLRIALLSREQIPGAFASLRANKRVARLDDGALLFDDAEAEALLRARLGEGVDVAARRAAQKSAHGWAAGLVLMSEQAAQQGGSVEAPIPTATGDALFDYFANEVFERMSESERSFMRVTALVAEISPEEAAAMTGRDDAQALLDAFCQRQLFVARLAGRSARYHYHDLFRAFLLSRLKKDVDAGILRGLRIRAAEAMIAADRAEEAIALFVDAHAWGRAAEQLESRARVMLQQGRRATLNLFVNGLPSAIVAERPWLIYWLGVAAMIDDAASACRHFGRAYEGFAAAGNSPAKTLTAAQAVLAIHMSWNTHVGAEIWVGRLGQSASATTGLSPSDRLRVATALIRAAGMTSEYRVNDAAVAAEVEVALAMIEAHSPEIDVNDLLVAADALHEHASALASADLFQRTVASITPSLSNSSVTPWAKCHWLISFGSVSGRRFPYRNDRFPYATSEDALQDAWRNANEHGLPSLRFAATWSLIVIARAQGNREKCELLCAQLQAEYDPAQPTQVCNYFQQHANQLGWRGDYEAALVAQVASEDAAERAQLPPTEWWSIHAFRAQILIALGRHDEAVALLDRHAPQYTGLYSQILAILRGTALWLAAGPGDATRRVASLRALLAETRVAGWSNYMTVIPAVVSQIWAEALEHDIERSFIVAAIRRRKLLPPAAYSPSWPWPLRVRLLGRLQVERDDELVNFGAKSQMKPLELLKVLASAPHHAVSTRQIMAWLWPGADAGSAKSSLDVTVHRLRRLLGVDEALSLAAGKLMLSPECVWVDAAAFEHWLDEAQRRLDAQPDLWEANGLAEQLFADYRGRLFGDDEPAPWSIGPRERLHQKFLQLSGSLGRFHEVRCNFVRAIAVYRRGLSEDQLAEELYRGVIRCQLAQNEPGAALQTFRRCREILSVVLGVAPAPATLALVSRIHGAGT